ncbi:hypothetical protein Plo01_78650 [Planobispora longispora]|uniref:Uncharacterized protein n=1 Tax=Planobispora longispora TaxID=28887 RepID=A0A8J3WB39_9ACTN|nr:hypothetical protein Plo01_78650 [Planobispora longispora]
MRRTVVTGSLGGGGMALAVFVLFIVMDWLVNIEAVAQVLFYLILIGTVAGAVGALPAAVVLALAAPWLAGRPRRSRLVPALACAAGSVLPLFLLATLLAGTDWSPPGFDPVFWSPTILAAILGAWRGPYLVGARSAEAPAPPAGAEDAGDAGKRGEGAGKTPEA